MHYTLPNLGSTTSLMDKIKPFEKEYPLSSFISGYYIDSRICDRILQYCEDNQHLKKETELKHGKTILRNSTDWPIRPFDYHHPFKAYRDALNSCLSEYLKRWDEAEKCEKFNIIESFNIQYYKPNQGFYPWHKEMTGTNNIEGKRHLVFMTYLNNVEDAGTEFMYQKITTPAKKGLTIIWPAGWTHTHRGVISKDKGKVIITGWYSFLHDLKPDIVYQRRDV